MPRVHGVVDNTTAAVHRAPGGRELPDHHRSSACPATMAHHRSTARSGSPSITLGDVYLRSLPSAAAFPAHVLLPSSSSPAESDVDFPREGGLLHLVIALDTLAHHSPSYLNSSMALISRNSARPPPTMAQPDTSPSAPAALVSNGSPASGYHHAGCLHHQLRARPPTSLGAQRCCLHTA